MLRDARVWRILKSRHSRLSRLPVSTSKAWLSASSFSIDAVMTANPSGEKLKPEAATGVFSTADCTRFPPSSTTRWANIPLMEWPTTWNRSQARLSASASTSAAASAGAYSPGMLREAP